MTRVIKAHLSCQPEGAIITRPQRLIFSVYLKNYAPLKSLIPNQQSQSNTRILTIWAALDG